MRDSFNKKLNKRRSLATSSGQLDWSRCYFLIQSLAGAMWWIGVFTVPGIRNATLGELPAELIAWFDIPLFVLGSLLLALGWRHGACVVLPWITLVTAAMFIYSLFIATAGLGALIMIASWVCSLLAATQMFIGRIPSELLIRGPFAFRTAPQRNVKGHFWRTANQLLCFWALFLCVIPAIILVIERRLNVMLHFPVELRLFGVPVLISASALGIWSAVTMSTRGQGTPPTFFHAPQIGHFRPVPLRQESDGSCRNHAGSSSGADIEFMARGGLCPRRITALELVNSPRGRGEPGGELRRRI